jgi:glycine betaine/proline transport system ATP-binding protein
LYPDTLFLRLIIRIVEWGIFGHLAQQESALGVLWGMRELNQTRTVIEGQSLNEEGGSRLAQLKVHNLYKIFGPHPDQALRLLEQGVSKQEIMEQTSHAIALQDVTMEIEPGEVFVVMGLSGSGKSTFVRCLNRLIEPTSGEIWLDDEDVLAMNQQQLRQLRLTRMSMVFQRFGLFPHRTVLENTAFGLEVQGVKKEKRHEAAARWLDVVGLKGWEESYPEQLSGGMQQRVGLARALTTDPEILLMDEPFSALDPLIRREMQGELLSLQAKLHKTIIFITHDLDEALYLGDRIAILKDGLVVQVGAPEEILTHPATEYVADFTRDVNRSRVITVETAMIKPRALAAQTAGPKVALQMMEEQGVSSAYVVDRQRRFRGIITLDEAVKAARSGAKSLEGHVMTDVPRTSPDTVLFDLMSVAAESPWPIAVVNDEDVLVGILPRVSVISALAANGDNQLPADLASQNGSGALESLDLAASKPESEAAESDKETDETVAIT